MFDLKLKKEKHHCFSLTAGDRDRTGTGITTHGILSPGRLPVPPRRHLPYYVVVKNTRYANITYRVSGAYRARTCDPLLVRQMLSQLS